MLSVYSTKRPSLLEGGPTKATRRSNSTTLLYYLVCALKVRVERTAQTLLEAGERELARSYLTSYCHTEASGGLRLVETLAESVEVRSKLLNRNGRSEDELE